MKQVTKQDPAQHEIALRLSRLQGPGELRAALLAFVRTRGSSRELRAWRACTQGLADAESIRTDVASLPPDARLPWFELLADRLKRHTESDRQGLVEAARKVMAADGKVGPQDRLLWLALRHRLGEAPPEQRKGHIDNELLTVDAPTARAVATFTAFLARLVPEASGEGAIGPAGQQWYGAVIERCVSPGRRAPLDPPDGDAMLRALRTLQGLPWMLRPVLARAWVDAAFAQAPKQLSPGRSQDSCAPPRGAGAVLGERGSSYDGRLPAQAADALRLACRLLESPMPPALIGQYIEPGISA